jgi:HK97 family phage portal protein
MKGTKVTYRLFGIPIFQRQVTAETDSSNPAPWLYEALGGLSTNSGISVNEQTALQFSAVYACVRVISDQIASFPKHIFKQVNDRERKKLYDHPAYKLIDKEPNEFCSAFDLWDAVTSSVLLWGNGFAHLNRDDNFNITSISFIHPSNIKIHYDYVGNTLVLVYEDTRVKDLIPPRDMLHFKGLTYDGVQGQGVIRNFAKESIGLSIVTERFGAKFFGNDTLLTKYVSHPAALGEEAYKRLRESLQKNYSGIDNAFGGGKGIPVFDEGMKLENVTIPNEQAQFIGTRQHQVEEICRWFKVQPHLIQHLLRSTNNNIEHQGIEFVTQTLTPWVVRFEHELNRKIFTEKEKNKLYVKFNMASLLRGDIVARTSHYTQMINAGVYNPNEVREMEDRNPREGGDEYLKAMNMTAGDKPEEKEEKEEDKKPKEKEDVVKDLKY